MCYTSDMESYNKTRQTENNNPHKNKVHHILARSYFMHFIFFLAGISLDLVFRLKIFANSFMMPAGVVLLTLATILILWAQYTTHHLKKDDISKETFCCGPYRYTRSPTHWGLFFLMLGFGVIANAFFVVLSTLFSFFIAKFIFLEKQEKILEEKYGAHYAEYKKLVKF